MTMIRTSLIAALGLLAAGSVAPSSAEAFGIAKPAIEAGDATGLLQVTDRRRELLRERGGWVDGRDRGYDRYYGGEDHRHDRRHFKRKKRKYYRRGYRRGYEEGFYEGRGRSRFERRHRHRHRDRGFRGGIYFGDGYFGGSDFRFRY